MRRLGPAVAAGVILVAGAALALPSPRARPHGGGPRGAAADGGTASAGDAGAADATAADASAADPASGLSVDGGAGAGDAGARTGSGAVPICVEHLPPGAARPVMTEHMPTRGVSGYATELRLVVAHGKGETVLPEGFHLQAASDAAKALEQAGFALPDPSGGVAPKISVSESTSGAAVTTITLPVVPLPPKGGRSELVLPPLPIAVARANNEYITICTAPHAIVVDDPIANELDPKVKPNPPARQQREDWPLARMLAVGVPIGGALALLGALLHRWWSRRPKLAPPAPKIPPWVTALEGLERVRRSDLLEQGKRGEHFDRVSDIIRRYLGARYGFDTLPEGYNGLETTTGEMLELLQRVRPPIAEMTRIKEFLDDCDLVKFARFTPDNTQCLETLARGEAIVRRTIPVMRLPADGPAKEAP